MKAKIIIFVLALIALISYDFFKTNANKPKPYEVNSTEATLSIDELFLVNSLASVYIQDSQLYLRITNPTNKEINTVSLRITSNFDNRISYVFDSMDPSEPWLVASPHGTGLFSTEIDGRQNRLLTRDGFDAEIITATAVSRDTIWYVERPNRRESTTDSNSVSTDSVSTAHDSTNA